MLMCCCYSYASPYFLILCRWIPPLVTAMLCVRIPKLEDLLGTGKGSMSCKKLRLHKQQIEIKYDGLVLAMIKHCGPAPSSVGMGLTYFENAIPSHGKRARK